MSAGGVSDRSGWRCACSLSLRRPGREPVREGGGGLLCPRHPPPATRDPTRSGRAGTGGEPAGGRGARRGPATSGRLEDQEQQLQRARLAKQTQRCDMASSMKAATALNEPLSLKMETFSPWPSMWLAPGSPPGGPAAAWS